MRRVSLMALLGSVTLLSCVDDPTTGLAVGGIAFEIHTVGIMPRSSAAGASEPAAVAGPIEVGPARTHGAAIDSARVVLTSPALTSARIVSATPGTSVTVSSLPVGTYAAELQGWHDGELVYQGNVSGIAVRSDEDNAVAQVLFAPTRLDFESIGETVQLTSPTGTTWSSAQSTIVQVSPTGLLTALTNGSASVSGTLASSTVGVQALVAQVVDSVEVTPASPTIAAGATQQFTARGFDAGGTEVTGVNALWVSANHLVATISPSGLATGTGAGTAAISASVRGEPGSANLTVTGEAPAAGLRFFVEPGNVSEKTAFTTSVAFVTSTGARAYGATGPVTLAIGTNPASGTLSGTLTVNAVAGLATFTNLSIDAVGVGYTLSATSGTLPERTTAAFDVVALTATKLRFVTEPASTTAGGTFNVSVQIENSLGARVVAATNAVTLAIGTNPASGTLSGVSTVNAVNGIATFNNLSINNVGTGYTLAASASSLTGTTSVSFNVVSTAPTHLAFTTIPSAGVLSNQSFFVNVQVRNALGSTASTSTDVITLAIGTNPSGGTLTGLATVNAVNGNAGFTVSIDDVGAGYTLVATSGSLTGATSTAFNVVSSAATQLSFNTSSFTVLPDQTFAFSVVFRNALGNIATTASDTVTLAIGTNPSAGTLSGVKKVTAVNGVANFGGLSIDNEGVGYTLTATSGSLTATPIAVTVASPAATQLTMSGGPPSALLPDSTFSISVIVRNELGNVVTTATNPVTLAIGANPGGGTLSGIKTVNAVGGVATFTGLSINNPGVGYTVVATSGSLTPATTSGFSIVLPPTQIAFRLQPGTTYATRNFPSTVQVELRDALGTRVTAGNYTVSLAIGTNPGGGTLSGSTAATSFTGVASFFGLQIDNKGTGYTLIASVSGLPDAVSAAFDVQGVVTVFMNGTYVDIVDDVPPGEAEAVNVYESLVALGQVVNQTTDISDAGVAAVLATSDVYVIPEQEILGLVAALGAGARAAIVAWVNAGGTLIVHRDVTLINTVFSLAIATAGGSPPYALNAAGATGTPFAGGPASVPSLSGTTPVEDTSLPGGSQAIYRSASTNDAAVAHIPRTSGRIVYIAWDWFEGPPVGQAAGHDWLEVLRRATQY